MKAKYLSYLLLILIQFSIINSKDTFTAEIMHSLHRLSSFVVSPKYQKKLNGEEINATPIEITPSTSEHTDSNPVFSSEFSNILFFLRSESTGSSVYYIDFPPTQNSEPVKLTSYEIDVSNLLLQKNTLVFSANVYFDCEDFKCTKDRDDEVAKRGSNTYSIYTK